jgi:hypothetical protein
MKKFDKLFLNGILILSIPVVIILFIFFTISQTSFSRDDETDELINQPQEVFYDTIKIKKIIYDTVKISIKPKEKPVTPPVDAKIDTTIK